MGSKNDHNQDTAWSLVEFLSLCELPDEVNEATFIRESRPRLSLRDLSFEELVEELSSEAF